FFSFFVRVWRNMRLASMTGAPRFLPITLDFLDVLIEALRFLREDPDLKQRKHQRREKLGNGRSVRRFARCETFWGRILYGGVFFTMGGRIANSGFADAAADA